MTVKDLIDLLKKFPEDMPVVYQEYSDYSELTEGAITVQELQFPRGDGYVGGFRADKPSQKWLAIA